MKKEVSAYGDDNLAKPLESECESVFSEPQMMTGAAVSQAGADEYLYLIGQPTLKQFLRFVKDRAVNPEGSGHLTEEWQTANAVMRRLEKKEAGIANNPAMEPVSPDSELLLEFLKNPLVRNSFNTVPTEVAYVNLNEQVIYQHHIDLTFVRRLEHNLKPSLTEEEIFRFCLREMVSHAQGHIRVCVSFQRSSFSWSDAAGGRAHSRLSASGQFGGSCRPGRGFRLQLFECHLRGRTADPEQRKSPRVRPARIGHYSCAVHRAACFLPRGVERSRVHRRHGCSQLFPEGTASDDAERLF